MDIAHTAAVALVALALDAVIGDPDWLWRRLAHPVAGMGAGIGWLGKRRDKLEVDERLRRGRGVAGALVLVHRIPPGEGDVETHGLPLE